jgi:hypothetical protein
MGKPDAKTEAKAESEEPKKHTLLLCNQDVDGLEIEINLAINEGYEFHSIAATYGKFCAVLKLA